VGAGSWPVPHLQNRARIEATCRPWRSSV